MQIEKSSLESLPGGHTSHCEEPICEAYLPTGQDVQYVGNGAVPLWTLKRPMPQGVQVLPSNQLPTSQYCVGRFVGKGDGKLELGRGDGGVVGHGVGLEVGGRVGYGVPVVGENVVVFATGIRWGENTSESRQRKRSEKKTWEST